MQIKDTEAERIHDDAFVCIAVVRPLKTFMMLWPKHVIQIKLPVLGTFSRITKATDVFYINFRRKNDEGARENLVTRFCEHTEKGTKTLHHTPGPHNTAASSQSKTHTCCYETPPATRPPQQNVSTPSVCPCVKGVRISL
ncbi:hypothetical protein V9T40_009002 [Parthenolecanium corni]|uniref:Uncharacterized protein n=1 Tax=Parthenolecanium corni TaxID=536013 RepID=A0AAN9TRH5_9HEMI